MVEIAEAEKNYAAKDFLYKYVREQVEEESTAKSIVEQLKRYGECHIGILDSKLSKR